MEYSSEQTSGTDPVVARERQTIKYTCYSLVKHRLY